MDNIFVRHYRQPESEYQTTAYCGVAMGPFTKGDGQRISPEPGRAHVEVLARRLYILAWVIEVVAVALGLGMALTLNVPGQSTFAEFLLGGGGFVMVACAELSKIPLATYFVEAPSRRAKYATLAFLVLMSVITFETIFMSLERGFNARMISVLSLNEEIGHLRSAHAKVSREVEDPTGDFAAKRRKLEERRESLQVNHERETATIEGRRAGIESRKRGEEVREEIKATIEAREKQLASLQEEHAKKIAGIQERVQRELNALETRIHRARKAGDLEAEASARRFKSAASRRGQNERTQAEKEYAKRRAALEEEIGKLGNERSERLRKREQEDNPRIAELDQQETKLHTDHLRMLDDLKLEESRLLAEEAEILGRVHENRLRRDELARQIKQKETAYRTAAAESQLHRIASPLAGWWSGKEYEPHTVPETYVRRVATIWFGSMAALGAVGGAVVAMVSQLLLQRAHPGTVSDAPAKPRSGTRAGTKLALTLRQYLVRRFSPTRVRTVEVVKTRREVIAVPVPVSGVSYEGLKKELASVSEQLTEQPKRPEQPEIDHG